MPLLSAVVAECFITNSGCGLKVFLAIECTYLSNMVSKYQIMNVDILSTFPQCAHQTRFSMSKDLTEIPIYVNFFALFSRKDRHVEVGADVS